MPQHTPDSRSHAVRQIERATSIQGICVRGCINDHLAMTSPPRNDSGPIVEVFAVQLPASGAAQPRAATKMLTSAAFPKFHDYSERIAARRSELSMTPVHVIASGCAASRLVSGKKQAARFAGGPQRAWRGRASWRSPRMWPVRGPGASGRSGVRPGAIAGRNDGTVSLRVPTPGMPCSGCGS